MFRCENEMLPSKKIVPAIVSVPGLPGVQAIRPIRLPCGVPDLAVVGERGRQVDGRRRLRFIVASLSNAGGVPVWSCTPASGPGFAFRYQ